MSLRKNRFRMIEDGIVNVKDFGATGDGVTDDTEAVKKALDYAYSFGEGSWKLKIPKVFFPSGDYVISQANYLLRDMRYARLNIEGEGKSATTITYTGASVEGEYLFNNEDQNTGFCNFSNIRFKGMQSGYFFYSASNGNAQNWTFRDCHFYDFDRLFHFAGTANDSENTWDCCKIGGMTHSSAEYIFNFDNPQCLNNRFFATDIEGFDCPLFYLRKGASIQYYQGSIIPQGDRASILLIDSSGSDFGQSNKPNLLMYGARFELHSGAKLINTWDMPTGILPKVIFNQCGMGGYQVPDGTITLDLSNGNDITFTECVDMFGHKLRTKAVGTNTFFTDLKFIRTQLSDDFIESADCTLTSSTGNTWQLPHVIMNESNDRYDGAFILVNGDKDLAAFHKQAPKYNRRDVSFLNNTKAARHSSGGVGTQDIYLPPSLFKRLHINIMQTSSYGGSATVQYNLYNSDRSVLLGTSKVFTCNSNDYDVIEFPYWIDTLNGDYLVLEVTSSYTGGTFTQNGSLSVEY